jgi:preprotein translocase subunit SecG
MLNAPVMYWTNLIIDVLLVFYVIDCVFLGFVIMMQRSKQEGLGAAFGGGFTESIWGAQTSQVLVKASVYAAIIFFALSIILARLYSVRATEAGQLSPVQQDLLTPIAAPAATSTLPGVSTNSAGTPVVPTATPIAPAPAKTPVPASK